MSAVTAESIRPSGATAPAAGRPDLHVETTCSTCSRPVTRVRNLRKPDEWVSLDGKDPEGAWWAAKDREGHWRVVRPLSGEDPPASGVRYGEHDCSMVSRVGRGLWSVVGAGVDVEHDPSMGWCAGQCGARCRAYGPNAEILCRDCRVVLEEWRKVPSLERGSVPFGKVVDGVYQRRST